MGKIQRKQIDFPKTHRYHICYYAEFDRDWSNETSVCIDNPPGKKLRLASAFPGK